MSKKCKVMFKIGGRSLVVWGKGVATGWMWQNPRVKRDMEKLSGVTDNVPCLIVGMV